MPRREMPSTASLPLTLPDLPSSSVSKERTSNKSTSKAKRAGERVGDVLLAPIVKAIQDAAESLSTTRDGEFTLSPLNPVRVVVALSGGRDSLSLLDVLAKFFHRSQQCLVARLRAVYINHGLSPNANSWQEHCRLACQARGVPFEAISVEVKAKGVGIEAAAREARYRALGRNAFERGDDMVITAHHEDDRLETFLLQFLRGAGPEGLAAFPVTRRLTTPGKLSRHPDVRPVLLLRPWVSVSRETIERYARSHKLQWVDDESNADVKYDRNRLRHEVMPVFEAMRPGFRTSASRSVDLVAEAVEVLQSVAAEDLAFCRDEQTPEALNVDRFQQLLPARQAWCLRHWLQHAGASVPTRAKLDDTLRQIRETRTDTTMTVRLGAKTLRRWGHLLLLQDATKPREASVGVQRITITGQEERLSLPDWRGELWVLPCVDRQPGIAVARLQSARLEVRSRVGGEKLKLWSLRPSKHLKDLFAEAQIPSFERADLPLLWMDNDLIYVAGLGLEIRACDDPDLFPERVRFEFHPDGGLWGQPTLTNYAEVHDGKKRRRAKSKNAAVKEKP